MYRTARKLPQLHIASPPMPLRHLTARTSEPRPRGIAVAVAVAVAHIPLTTPLYSISVLAETCVSIRVPFGECAVAVSVVALLWCFDQSCQQKIVFQGI
jgi:hypothetical protein